MQTESLGKVLPRILFPYVQQWAERSGLTLLSRLLVDDQFRELIEKFSDGLVTPLSQPGPTPGNGNGQGNGNRSTSQAEPQVRNLGTEADAGDLTDLHARVLAMEAQQEAQQAQFEILRSKIRPLALALGCCPECLVGVDGCPKCWGRSRVAHYPPDYVLLRAQVVDPLAAHGVPLTLGEAHESRTGRQSGSISETRKRSKPWPKK